MAIKIKTQPAVEPVSLAEAKLHLRIESQALEDNIEELSSIAPGAHVAAASYSKKGVGVEVSGYDAVAVLAPGGNGAGGTVNVKLQEAEEDSEANYSDVSGGTFTQVTEINDDADDIQELAYTGSARYLRAVATIAGATCAFAVNIIRKAGPTVEDTELTSIIKGARTFAEWKLAWRSFITQTLELWLDEWPEEDFIKLLQPPVQEPAVTAGSFVTGTVYRILSIGTTNFMLIGAASNTVGVCFKATGAGTGTGTATASGVITYYGTDDTAYYASGIALAKADQYEPKLYLRTGESWPSTELRPHEGICITYIAGYGDAATDVPSDTINGLKLLITDAYENRGDIVPGSVSANLKRAEELICGSKAY